MTKLNVVLAVHASRCQHYVFLASTGHFMSVSFGLGIRSRDRDQHTDVWLGGDRYRDVPHFLVHQSGLKTASSVFFSLDSLLVALRQLGSAVDCRVPIRVLAVVVVDVGVVVVLLLIEVPVPAKQSRRDVLRRGDVVLGRDVFVVDDVVVVVV